MNSKLRIIDFHVVTLSAIVSLLSLGLASVITFVPGQAAVIAFVFGVVPAILFVEPTVLVRARDRAKGAGQALAYFYANTLVILLFSAACGLLVFSMVS
jgi:hypothetical protein